ncbi:MAG: FlgD immunoglobulin-like domain containing protein, partial [Elusimicrobiota bacterium]
AAHAGGGTVRGAPTLAILPLEKDGKDHLVWKMRVDSSGGGGWRYYVDAVTGQVLLRFSVREFASGPCLSSGVVSGEVYDIDPSSTPGPAVRRFNNQYVYVGTNPTPVVTANDSVYGDGFFCGQTSGKTTMALQGPYVSVSQFRGPSAHFDNGNGVWSTVATPVSSPHPYPPNSNITAKINVGNLAPNAIEFLPVFSAFAVGSFDGGSGEGSGDISDDDRLEITDGSGREVAHYIGARGAFNGAAVFGPTMNLTLLSNPSSSQPGYDVAISSYLTMPSPNTGGPGFGHTWVSSDTWLGQLESNAHGEISLFYHLNQIHDFLTSDVDALGGAPLNKPFVAMSHVGPNLLNAFYDPDYDDLSFGDVNTQAPSDMFMDDATVPHHEYTHYMVQKIWDLQNYGQAGTLSEANADYWSATSLNDPAIGTFVIASLGGSGPLRQIDDQAVNATFFNLATGNPAWTGEIHADSPYLSQAMWDIRRAEIARLPTPMQFGNKSYSMGQSCADGLVFEALLFFPESFSEMYEDMLEVDRSGRVANCGGASTAQADITAAFAAHGLIRQGDAYESNDGFETATDISTLNVVAATIYPTADEDFYSFGAGPGLVSITMKLPAAGGGLYFDYQMRLYNVSHQIVASAAPPANGFGTADGLCGGPDCTTNSSAVSISYNNPTGQLLYVQVVGGDSENGSNSGVESTTPYVLDVKFPALRALAGGVVGAHYDNDLIGFTVNTSTFGGAPDWNFAYAQLRDESNAVVPNTATNLAGGWLTVANAATAAGQITGTVELVPGFASRFPAVGTVALEVFAYDVHGSTSSMGISNTFNLSDQSMSEFTAYNNLFNPLLGQKATIKYAMPNAGNLTVKVYTVTGRLVTTLFDGNAPAGKGSVDWNGQNSAGVVVASGIYVVRGFGPGLNATQKIAVIK